jgi:rod shape-determining protein MreB
MPLFSKDLGIDLGTVYTRIAEGGEIVLQEPTIVAVEIEENKMVAVGQEALSMLGRVSEENIQVTRPLQNGVVAYFERTERLLEILVRKVGGSIRL